MPAYFPRTPATPADTGATLPPPAISVDFEAGPQRILARVRGEIDIDHANALREDLVSALEASRLGLDVDLSGVTFCDSSGLHLLLDLNRMASGTGKSLVLTALSRRVSRLLDVTGTQEVFTVRGPADPTGSGRASPA
ncbi:STAS domain-containing protein [Streptomyces sp. NPDC059874]|uniref:STAS domain-containing protein n=1 Tax=Streptomyces sp. NPDC059874 TaxID=3346983 RepID=UPI003655F24C